MRYDEPSKKFVRCLLRESIKSFASADEQSYIILHNPVTKDGKLVFPNKASLNKPEELEYGKKVNITGPMTFPLWPGQIAEVVLGHQLRSNQYLLVKVSNASEATKNYKEATIETTTEGKADIKSNKTFITGQLMIIKGTDVSFYIPPTGLEVVRDSNGNYVRDALTLERIEYCVLKDENGAKRYEKGPAVVFPKPTETFITKSGGGNVFKAVELNESMGLYIKVISSYSENGKKYTEGEELFITGKDQKIYFPREEHAIIKYGKQIIHYAVAIPKGDARYVLDKVTGEVKIVQGPTMFLPDPRKEVVVKRILDVRDVELMFPGNKDALEYNLKNSKGESDTYFGYNTADISAKALKESAGQYSRSTMRFTDESTIDEFADGLKRLTEYTPPRTITLDNKYEGCVLINVWPGYAVQVVSKNGNRKVIVGPKAVFLEFDETLEKLTLSTGRPKTDTKTLATAYLHVKNNKVSDVVKITTSDLVDVDLLLSYRVNFEGDESKWFSVHNYTKLLTDHLRSVIRNAAKKYGIEEFNANAIDIVRDTILGVSKDGKRTGKIFDENGMRVYDVEVLEVKISDPAISKLLIDNQHKTVANTINLIQTKKGLEIVKAIEEANQIIIQLQNKTNLERIESEKQILEKKAEREKVELDANVKRQESLDIIAEAELERKKKEDQRKIERLEKQTQIITQAHIDRMEAITPDLIAAINALGDKQLAEALVQNLPKATGTNGYLFGVGGTDGLLKMVAGTPLEKTLKEVLSKTSVDIDPNKTPSYNDDSSED